MTQIDGEGGEGAEEVCTLARGALKSSRSKRLFTVPAVTSMKPPGSLVLAKRRCSLPQLTALALDHTDLAIWQQLSGLLACLATMLTVSKPNQ